MFNRRPSQRIVSTSFTRLVQWRLEDNSKADPQATYEEALRQVAKERPDLWDKHIKFVAGNGQEF